MPPSILDEPPVTIICIFPSTWALGSSSDEPLVGCYFIIPYAQDTIPCSKLQVYRGNGKSPASRFPYLVNHPPLVFPNWPSHLALCGYHLCKLQLKPSSSRNSCLLQHQRAKGWESHERETCSPLFTTEQLPCVNKKFLILLRMTNCCYLCKIFKTAEVRSTDALDIKKQLATITLWSRKHYVYFCTHLNKSGWSRWTKLP